MSGNQVVRGSLCTLHSELSHVAGAHRQVVPPAGGPAAARRVVTQAAQMWNAHPVKTYAPSSFESGREKSLACCASWVWEAQRQNVVAYGRVCTPCVEPWLAQQETTRGQQ